MIKGTGKVFRSCRKAGVCLLVFWLSALVGLCGTALAAPVGPDRAHKLVDAWRAKDARPFGSRLGNEVNNVETFSEAEGRPIYYVVYLCPNGFVIVPADDEVEPIICFSSEGSYDPSERNPLGALVSRDLPARVNSVRAVQMKTLAGRTAVSLTDNETAWRKSAEKARGKWTRLISEANESGPRAKSLAGVSDVRISPLVQSKWSQSTVGGKACYNYYTPPYGSGNTNNYVCGCVATAMAQYMKYQTHPVAGVGTDSFTITVDSEPQPESLLGGNGSGGAYKWDKMPLVPGSSITYEQSQAIGALTHDAGVAVKTDYEVDGSSAYLEVATDELVATFGYSNAIFGFNDNSNIGDGLAAMINPNLDSNNPVILGIAGSGGGHAVVADGYGYQSSTLYHHLNMGWSGSSDAWYNLPAVTSSFNVVDNAIYNIYVAGTGEIISGRVTHVDSGLPISGAIVTAKRSGGGTYTAAGTNAKGIYYIADVPSNSTYTMGVTKDGYSFSTQTASTGESTSYEAVSGNCWAVDFVGMEAEGVPVASDSNFTAEVQVPKTITLQAFDDSQPDPPGALTYIITSLPRRGILNDPSAGSIGDDDLPYSLSGYGKNVIYTSISNYTGFDSFQFKVNDGGSPPTGGDSSGATIGITVQPPAQEIVYETGFDTGLLPAGWAIVDGGNDGYTWQSDNPCDHGSPYLTDPFMIVDSDCAGPVDMDEQLITHSIDCTNWTDVKLKFKHYFCHWSGEIGDVDVRINGGIWRNVKRYRGADSYGDVEFALSSFGADGSTNMQIRWHYYKANNCWFWGIDDVQIITADAVPIVTVEKCTVTAGSKKNTDKISFSGKMRATTYDVCDTNVINVIVSSDDINKSLVLNFPVDGNTFKKNKYSYSKTIGGVRKSFAYDPKTRKYYFSASNVDLLGLDCPITVGIVIGDYNSLTDVYETIVNGPKVPIPVKLMTGVKNVLRVDKCQVKHGKDPNSDQLSVKGAFAVENPDVNMPNRVKDGLVITLDTQIFTIPKENLKVGKDKFTCSNVKITGGTATATFNFKLCSFTLTIKNTNIDAISGDVDFGVAFADFDEVVQIMLL
ncbi:MAG: C10 family peptidase [Sedimentisphaerales bacterium]